MNFKHVSLAPGDLLPSSVNPLMIKFAPVATIANYTIEYVGYEPGASFPDHSHLDNEWILVCAGDLSDGQSTFGPNTLLSYPVGSSHENLRSAKGAQFLLIWTGSDRFDSTAKRGPSFSAQRVEDLIMQPSKVRPGSVEACTLAEVGDYLIRYVRWKRQTSYQDHVHLATESIILLSGDIADGSDAFVPPCLLTYPPGSRHENLRTDAGAEFVFLRKKEGHMQLI